MADSSMEKGPNRVHPTEPGAIGSRNSIYREGRDEYAESKLIIEDEINQILSHMETKLPADVLEKLHVGGNIKDLLHNYFNQSFHNMYNRYLVTAEDELSKKFRDMVDREEYRTLGGYTPKQVPDLLDALGGDSKFNNAKVDQSIVGIYGHLQAHLQNSVQDLKRRTQQMLLGRTDMGSMVREDHTYSVVKCQFTDNKLKPETVTDVELVINVLESELLNPVFHFQAATGNIIKDAISSHILSKLDQEIQELAAKISADGQSSMSEPEQIFEKFKRLESYIDFNNANESPQYNYVAKEFFHKLEGLGSEISKTQNYDPLNIRETLQRIVDEGNLRTSGFNQAVNALTNILDERQLGYQHIENFKNARKVVISEYADRNQVDLPDEKYSISLYYYDDEQLKAMRVAYAQQLEEITDQVHKLSDVYEKIAKAERRQQRQGGSQVMSFQELSAYYTKGTPLPQNAPAQESLMSKLFGGKPAQTTGLSPIQESAMEQEGEKKWDEISFIQPEKSDREKLNDTFMQQRVYLNKKLALLRGRLAETFGRKQPAERMILEQRLDFLESNLETFAKKFNPFNVRPGLFVELSFSTIRNKKSTLTSMSDVLSSFLDSVAKGFTDASGAGYHNRKDVGVVLPKVAFAVMPEAEPAN